MTLCSKYHPSMIYTPLSALKSRVHGLKALYEEDFVPFRITASSNRVNREYDEYLIEMRIEKEDMAELMQLKKEDLLFDVKTVPYSLVSDVENTRRKSLNSQTAESLAT
ncbi:hypothetical protein AVEN_108578-1 [Araneus ventricosus]|uniref:Uncharacterized protein n=1 Tax=Araneus ventricosus TaxID=182803 RepID=A0A4Y2DID7_ARAVE|nr:hypothetical protein AVEN_108578-1 [Araneus ventricosus]